MPDQLPERIPEPELMDDMEQAKAYAMADFQEPHDMFVAEFRKRFGTGITGLVLDLGCGTADITCRFAKAYPDTTIHGIDGSEAMLHFARKALTDHGLAKRILLFKKLVPCQDLPAEDYDVIIVNSLLHHLPDPHALWQTVKQAARKDTAFFLMDLSRPESPEKSREIVETYSGREPDILKRDFFNSLLAAFRPEEVMEQLKDAGLDYLNTDILSDRHLSVWGHLR